ncbi:MAG TPA: metal ABC transporter permease [Candidatus Dormibacteraeota bacterium]
MNPLEVEFMRNAFVAGGCIALAAGLVGYFVVLRNQVFSADALGHVAFTGSLGGVLIGFNLVVSAIGSCIAAALAIGTLGGRGRSRDVAVGTVFAWVLGVGVLFLSLYTTTRSAASGSLGITVLFGSILGLQPFQVIAGSLASIAICVVVLLVARPLLFLSIDPDVAIARGIPARALTALFAVLVAVTVAVSVQAVGALLIFALMVTPAAIAQNLSARPWVAMPLSALIAVAVVWLGLVLAYYFPYPASFFITALAFAAYLASQLLRRLPLSTLLAAAVVLGACGLGQPTPAASGKVEVVAAESFWGSIATQVGGDRVHVTSIIANPDTDPHDYDPTPADARLFAQARYVIVNGVGYDTWATKLLEANPTSGRKVLNVGDLAGKKEGDNPHLWYSPSIVEKVIDRIGKDLDAIDSARQLWDVGFKDYRNTIDTIKRTYAGTRVGGTESVFVYLVEATGLDLITPRGYLNAVSEGNDPSAADKSTMLNQIERKLIKVLLFNSQNSTPEIQGLVNKARAKGIPIVQMTETPVPTDATFQAWQTAQLQALLQALSRTA